MLLPHSLWTTLVNLAPTTGVIAGCLGASLPARPVGSILHRDNYRGTRTDALTVLHCLEKIGLLVNRALGEFWTPRLQNVCRHMEKVKFDTDVGTRAHPLSSKRGFNLFRVCFRHTSSPQKVNSLGAWAVAFERRH